MKLFAIITAGLMATGGAVYFYSVSPCSKSGCPLTSTAPVAKTGGCCPLGDLPECCAHDESSTIQEASLAVATNVNASVGAKTVETGGCCEACVVTPTFTIVTAAKSVVTAK